MSKHKDKDKTRSRSRSRSKDRERREKKKSKKSKRSRSKERKHRRSRTRSRSSSTEHHRRHRREERYEREREVREKELEKERLRQIALEFKQSGAFSSIAQQSQSFLQPQEQIIPSLLSSFSSFSSFPVSGIAQPAIEIPQMQPKERSQAYLEAVEASKRIAASKNFVDTFSCSNSNDSMSNGPTNIEIISNNRDVDSTTRERARKKKSRWGGSENDKTFIPGMPTVLPQSLDSNQTEAYLVQLQIEEISRKLRTGELGIASVEERSPSPEPIYSSDGKRLNTREFRTRKRLEEQRHQLILRMQCMNPDFKPPSDYKAPVIRVSDKVLIPQEEHPDINFVGLLIGPRGNTLKAMEKETGAKIIIRGKGSVKEGKVGRKDGQPLPGEDEPLHAFITAANADCVKKAVEKINEVIKQGIEVPEGHNDLRRMQLRELAQLNGTLRETDVPRCTNCGSNEHKSWLCPDKPNVTNNIMCSSCGAAGHIAKDCKAKRPGQGGPPLVNPNSQAKIDEEYLSLMAELGEGPPANKSNDSLSTQSSASSNRNQFSIFERNQGPLKAIAPVPTPPSSVPAPIQQPRMPPNNWNGQPPAMPPLPPPPGGSYAMPPPSIRPPMWNNQPQIPGTDLPPVPSGNAPPPFVPPPPPGTSNWSAPLPPPPAQQYPWSNGSNFVPPLPAVPPPPPPPPGS